MKYVDANRVEHEDYEAACRYYGADSPRQLKAAADRAAAQYEADVLAYGRAQADAWAIEGKYHV